MKMKNRKNRKIERKIQFNNVFFLLIANDSSESVLAWCFHLARRVSIGSPQERIEFSLDFAERLDFLVGLSKRRREQHAAQQDGGGWLVHYFSRLTLQRKKKAKKILEKNFQIIFPKNKNRNSIESVFLSN